MMCAWAERGCFVLKWVLEAPVCVSGSSSAESAWRGRWQCEPHLCGKRGVRLLWGPVGSPWGGEAHLQS